MEEPKQQQQQQLWPPPRLELGKEKPRKTPNFTQVERISLCSKWCVRAAIGKTIFIPFSVNTPFELEVSRETEASGIFTLLKVETSKVATRQERVNIPPPED